MMRLELAYTLSGAHPATMFVRRRVWPVRSSSSVSAAFALAIVLVGVLAAPFCRCVCVHDDAEAAEAPSHHGHADSHGMDEPVPGHPCEHGGCAGLTAVLPAPPVEALIASSPAPAMVADQAPLALELVFDRLARMRPGIDRDVGPPVPASLFSILRP
jgi:hypothetical protein